jgi:hypothetical protein
MISKNPHYVPYLYSHEEEDDEDDDDVKMLVAFHKLARHEK